MDPEAAKTDAAVIARVCSAGGLIALSAVLEPLPHDFPAAVLILQHTSPEYDSHLAEILDQRTALPVRAATDGQPILAGQVFVAPSGRHLLVTPQRTLALIPSGRFPPSRPSADLLLTTLAMAVGPQVIAVVLTGGGQDGATGATAVHHRGGLVLASDEATSQYFAMPQATISRDNAIGLVLPVDEIGHRLIELTSAPILAGPLSVPSLQPNQ
ncbi:chemotaxis protein CheB [Cryptosporangium sp. NPDC048952]|uniref:chemotaxis protein CheB n=1 Tax=Cryptosporangium sp. NPDC048952 TaxID=3363961 RepID=UPI003716E846